MKGVIPPLVLACIAFVVAGAVGAHAYRPPAKWILEQAATRQARRQHRTLRIESEALVGEAALGAKTRRHAGHPPQVRAEVFAFRLPAQAHHSIATDDVLAYWVLDKTRSGLVNDSALDEAVLSLPAWFSTYLNLATWEARFAGIEALWAATEAMGVNLDEVSLGRFGGRVVWIIGAREENLKVPQIWLDMDTFVPMRIVDKVRGADTLRDTRLHRYGTTIAGQRFPGTMEVYVDGVLHRRSILRAASVDGTLPASLFRVPG